jgi:dTDP-4-amino-4,6-dideoxygalactose transaminase
MSAEVPIHRPFVGEEEAEAVRRVLASRWLGMGAVTRSFEERLEQYLGARHVVAVSSCSAALHLALAACELQPDDEVILPSLTFAACPQAVLAAGGRPVFCDVTPETLSLDVDDVARRITPRTRAIMPVHYGGFACPMDDVLALAGNAGARVVEDAAHAFGSAYRGQMVGTLGDLTCFSFDPVKNVTCGEGGAVATDDDDLAQRVRLGRNLGISRDSWVRRDAPRSWAYNVVASGFRYHMSDVHAAIGLVQLDRVDEVKERKRQLVRLYVEGLHGVDGVEPVIGDVDSAFPFLFAVRVPVKRRDALLDFLLSRGVHAWVHFLPNHLEPVFAGFREALPVTERVAREVMSLPLYYELSDGDVERVCDFIRAFFEQTGERRRASAGPRHAEVRGRARPSGPRARTQSVG